MNFITGYRDVDMLVLDQLTDADLFNACQVNAYSRNLCSTLLRNRIINRTGLTFAKLNTIKTNMGLTWVQFYIFLYY